MATTALTNVTIITMNTNKEIIENGVVIITDDIITDIGDGDSLEANTAHKIIDGKNGILIPGMVNGHVHASMTAFRSLGDDVPNRLKKYLFPLEKELVNSDLVYTGAKYGIAEMLLGGVTTFVDMYYFEDSVAKAADEMGIRAILGETVVDFPAPDTPEPYGGIAIAEDFIKSWKGHPLITPAIAPHAPYTVDANHLRQCMAVAGDHDVPMTMHLAEMDFETDKFKKEFGVTPVRYLDDMGVLNRRLIAAHCINLTDDDIRLLSNKGVGIIHNPGSNAKGGKGVAPVIELLRNNVSVGLGTDGPMSGNTLDLITQMNLVPKIHKMFNRDRSLMPAVDVVEMATMGGARALGMSDSIGSIEIGKKADLVLLETDSVNMQPIFDYYSVLVYSANPSNVSMVMINGSVVVDDKQLVHQDLKSLQTDLVDLKDAVLKVAGKL